MHRDRWFYVMFYLLHQAVSPRALHGGWGLPQSPWVLQTVMDGESQSLDLVSPFALPPPPLYIGRGGGAQCSW